ncbi:SDR family oxidoreductase [Actinopolyspora mortivallis]|nr:SDR family oxidoreductase [Actinopolyspora mortivallis]
MVTSSDFAGRVVLVTGSSRGMGFVTARTFARRGAHVVINYFHSSQQAEQAVASLREEGLSVESLRASVAKKDEVEEMVTLVTERHGRLDVLVNNAAVGIFRPLEELTEKNWTRVLDTNLNGTRWCSLAAATWMKEHGGGVIVNVSSIGAELVVGNYAAVGVSKAAVEALTRYLAAEYGPYGIRVNSASANIVEGEVANLFPRAAEFLQVVRSATPLGRASRPEDLAELVVYLASSAASGISGQSMLADGGLSTGSAMLSPPRREPERESVEAPSSSSVPLTSSGRAPAAGYGPRGEPDEGAADERGIAVVGAGVALPGASTPEQLWTLLNRNQSVFSEPGSSYRAEDFYDSNPDAEDRTYTVRAGHMHGFEPHPVLAEELARGDIGEADGVVTQWVRHCVLHALDGGTTRERDRFATYLGAWSDGSYDLEETLLSEDILVTLRSWCGDADLDRVREVIRRHLPRARHDATRLLPSRILARAVSGLAPEHGNAAFVDTACSSSLYALDLGARALREGECDIALCGGWQQQSARYSVLFANVNGLSPSGNLRVFDKDADGTLFTDGACVLALKTVERAREDGDDILAVLGGFGAAADGRGKAIYAPNPKGQRLALRRSWQRGGLGDGELDWVLAHATGTPEGDASELTTIAETTSEAPITVSSNKSVLGHTGWAAGAVSVLHAVLSLRRHRIPAQHHFDELPEHVNVSGPRVPDEPVDWSPRADRPRRAGVSAFGFGGTNAHLVVEEPHAGTRTPAVHRSAEDIVLVGWEAMLPGDPDRERLRTWLHTGFPPRRSFGENYPAPEPATMRLTPKALRGIDRTQQMAVQVVRRLAESHGTLWAGLEETTGVLCGTEEPLRISQGSSVRAYRDVLSRLADDLAREHGEAARDVLADYWESTRRRIPPHSEDHLPGLLPNVTASRVANRFDLTGVAAAVGAGRDSFLAALRTGMSYLRDGDLDVALVLGVNGNTTPWVAAFHGIDDRRTAEGAFAFFVTRRDLARRYSWPVLGTLAPERSGRNGTVVSQQDPTFLTADGAVALLRGVTGEERSTVIVGSEYGTDHAVAFTAESQPCPTASAPVERPDRRTERYVLTHVPDPGETVREAADVLGAEHLVLTNDAGVARTAAERTAGRATVLCTESTPNDERVTTVGTVEADTLDRLGITPAMCRHIRVFASVTAPQDGGDALDRPPSSLSRLHEVAFLAAKAGAHGPLLTGSLLVLQLGAEHEFGAHPHAALLTGTVKSLAWDLPECRLLSLSTSSTDPEQAFAELERESTLSHALPEVHRRNGHRLTPRLRPEPVSRESGSLVDDDSVLVVSGGGRGITAECLRGLAGHTRPHVWILGTTSYEDAPTEEPPDNRAEFLTWRRRHHPRDHFTEHLRAYQRHRRGVETRRTVRDLRELLGEDRLHYLVCDISDREQVRAAADRVLAEHDHIDLFVHAAGINRAAGLDSKSLDDVRAVLGAKVDGYHNLVDAFGSRTKHWCNFGSLAGTLGLSGESDYAAANDYLSASGTYRGRRDGVDEFTIGWTMWAETGMGSDRMAQSLTERKNVLTPLDNSEGVSHFLDELRATRHGTHVVHQLGDNELDTIERVTPGLLRSSSSEGAPRRHDAAGDPGEPPLLDELLEKSPTHQVWRYDFDPGRDSYLYSHLVQGRPTLPGTFHLELGAEAATVLVPGTRVLGFEHVVFHTFLCLPTHGTGSLCRVIAERSEEQGGIIRVRARLVSDVLSGDGRVLLSGREHSTFDVLLTDTTPEAEVRDVPEVDECPVPDPYFLEGSPVELAGPFSANADCRIGNTMSAATWNTASVGDRITDRILLPAVMLDSLARTHVLDPHRPDRLAVAVPTSLRRIDLNTALNDRAIARQHPDTVVLLAEPGSEGNMDKLESVTSTGQVLARVTGTSSHPLGWAVRNHHGWHMHRGG